MKTTKITLILTFLTVSLTLMGQLNPVNNLYYQQTYDYGNSFCPSYNCFSLTWTQPNSSSDTLKGYHVYRNDVFWVFTSQTSVSCSGIAPCPYPGFYDVLPFWIKVKAVYNADSLESIADDSVHVSDLAITIDEIRETDFLLIKNPVKKGESISLILPYNGQENCVIRITASSGVIAKECHIKNNYGNKVNISSTGLECGMYFIELLSNVYQKRLKLLIN